MATDTLEAFTERVKSGLVECWKEQNNFIVDLDYQKKDGDEPVPIRDEFQTKLNFFTNKEPMLTFFDKLTNTINFYRRVYVFSPPTQQFTITSLNLEIGNQDESYFINTYFSFVVSPQFIQP